MERASGLILNTADEFESLTGFGIIGKVNGMKIIIGNQKLIGKIFYRYK